MTLAGPVLAALLLPIPIGAAEAAPEVPPTTARLEVRAAPECTSYDDLAARVAARSPRIQFVDQAALYAQVTLTTPRPGSVAAEVVLSATDGKPAPRRVTARSCAEAADAVALIIAVTLDPTIARKETTSPVPNQGTATNGEAVSRVAPTTKTGSPRPPEPPAASLPPPVDKPAEQPDIAKPPAEPAAVVSVAPPPPGPSATTRYRFGAHLAGQTVLGPAPAVMPGVALYALAALERDGPWAPAIILGALHAWRSDLAELGGTASFALDAGSVDACPLRLRWASLVARPCASLLVGRMTASGGGASVTEAASRERPFAVAGGTMVLAFGVGSTVELTGRLSTGATLIRDSYGFSPTVFHRASLLTTSASLGLGIRWP